MLWLDSCDISETNASHHTLNQEGQPPLANARERWPEGYDFQDRYTQVPIPR